MLSQLLFTTNPIYRIYHINKNLLASLTRKKIIIWDKRIEKVINYLKINDLKLDFYHPHIIAKMIATNNESVIIGSQLSDVYIFV